MIAWSSATRSCSPHAAGRPAGPENQPIPLWATQTGGTGDWFTHSGYGTAGAIGNGCLVSGNSLEGLTRVTKSQAGDPVETAAITAGRKEYAERFLHLLHGAGGFGFYGFALPWGVSADIDAYLQFQGHAIGS